MWSRAEQFYYIKQKNPWDISNQVFWKTALNDAKPKLTIQVKGIEIENLVDIGADVTKFYQNLHKQIGLFSK